MLRTAILTAAVIVAAVPTVRADEAKPTYFLKADGTVEARVASLEKRVADLEKAAKPAAPKVTTLAESGPGVLGTSPLVVPLKPKAGCICDGDCACKAGTCPGGCPVAAKPPAGIPADYQYANLPGIGWTWACPATMAAHKAGTLRPQYVGGTPAPLAATTSGGHWVRQCNGNSCSMVWVKD